jgi:hypothetical protein
MEEKETDPESGVPTLVQLSNRGIDTFEDFQQTGTKTYYVDPPIL